MSIINCFVFPDRVLLGFDSESSTPDGRFLEGCKVIFLPHLSAAIGFRGAADLFAFSSPSLVGFDGDFDNLADRLPQIIRGSRSAFIAHYGDSPNTQAACNFVLAGHSLKLGRMVGHAFECADGSSDIAEIRDCPQIIAPAFGESWIRALGIQADRPGMIRLATDQCERVRAENSSWPAGGRLYVAELRKGSITIDEMLIFPPRGAK